MIANVATFRKRTACSGDSRSWGLPRTAFTFIEFLAVLVIVVILLMILTPALVRARHSAQSIQCQNNLRQLGLALQNYLDTYSVYPPGYTHSLRPNVAGNQSGFGWAALLLPYSEQQSLYGSLDFSVPIWDDANAPARTAHVSGYVCPTDQTSEDDFLSSNGELYAPSSYAGSFGPGQMDVDPNDGGGVFGRNSATGPKHVADGLSNTIFLGERMRGPLSVRPSGAGLEAIGALDRFETVWAGAASNPADSSDDNPHWVLFQSGHVPLSADSDRRDASSSHQAGAHFLMGDGSVRFLSKDIGVKIYRSMSTRAGGELMNNDF